MPTTSTVVGDVKSVKSKSRAFRLIILLALLRSTGKVVTANV